MLEGSTEDNFLTKYNMIEYPHGVLSHRALIEHRGTLMKEDTFFAS